MAGRRIDDHSSWVGKGTDGSVFPMGCKVRDEESAEGAGELMYYEDTSSAIKSQQDKGISQAKKHPMKPGYRY